MATPPPTPSDIDPGLAGLIEKAIHDLANRLDIDTDRITALSGRLVEWPDTSLGCPQPGMAYAQIPQDGALIVLAAEGTTYAYHSGGFEDPFLCENPVGGPRDPG